MKLTSVLSASLLVLAPLVAAAPVKRNTGSYTVSGLGNRKKAITAAGGTDLDLAIAMMETENMQATYTYGDGKTGDSFNAGIFKQNWYMLRSATSRYRGQSSSQYNNAAEMNSNLSLDISERHEAQNYYGETLWFAGHRNGQTGLSNPNTQDIKNIQSNSKYRTDDTRFWIDGIPPI
ncbi:hypothetical protein FRC06_003139 [Ceratobasidium sp. 370]|nr:hypothetical protein FRC06_003139 [Ceratobasidium sp. 370]